VDEIEHSESLFKMIMQQVYIHFVFLKGGGVLYRAKRQYEFLTLSRGHDCQLITF